MNPTLTPSQFTSPDIRPRGVSALPGADLTPLDLDMQQVQEELAAALRHIEDLPRRHPYEDTGHAPKPL
ncbi:hypothetical protein AB0G98_21730 [Streptomyces sp. NPDC020196]|uniref:hypothetical protein n=1 Tax=Streptomyces sp. NPDC020196 TaxID=3156656 RepID=UPI0033E712F1